MGFSIARLSAVISGKVIETANQTMLSVAEVCDRFSVWAAMRSIEELAASRVIEETKES
jgi:hypothetical protein